MRNPKPLVPDRIRNIRQCTFGWVDHDFLHRGFLNRLSPEELLLYYFLITVADRNGVSFYDYERICQFLKMEADDYARTRNRLCERSLLAYQEGVFQVLALPEEPRLVPVPRRPARPGVRASPLDNPGREGLSAVAQAGRRANGDFQALREVLINLSDEK